MNGLTYGSTSISLGTLIAIPLVSVLALLCFGFAIWLVRLYREEDDGLFLVLAIAGFLGGIAFLVGLGIGMYPWQAQYHHWQQQTGTVERIRSRLAVGSGANQRFVVEFKGGEQRSCDDTRCALLRPGDLLTLTCKREWQFAGTDGWSCNYVSVRTKA